jgi:hypothetical protein
MKPVKYRVENGPNIGLSMAAPSLLGRDYGFQNRPLRVG